MSYSETMRVIEAEIPNVEGLLSSIDMGSVYIEVSNDWFLKFDIKPRGIQHPTKMCWLLSYKEFEELCDTRPGENRQQGVGYRWKEVY